MHGSLWIGTLTQHPSLQNYSNLIYTGMCTVSNDFVFVSMTAACACFHDTVIDEDCATYLEKSQVNGLYSGMWKKREREGVHAQFIPLQYS